MMSSIRQEVDLTLDISVNYELREIKEGPDLKLEMIKEKDTSTAFPDPKLIPILNLDDPHILKPLIVPNNILLGVQMPPKNKKSSRSITNRPNL